MASKDERLIVYEKITNLVFYAKNLLNKYPKSERFDLCANIKNSLYFIERQVIFAWKENDERKRKEYLKNADIEIYVLKTFVRISFLSKYITEKNYMVWNEKLSEIGRMIGGWLKRCPKG